jgi:hypothetical protein
MADTGEQKYSKKEALHRIYLILTGQTETNDTPDTAIKGELYSEDQSLSKIAEVMSDSLPGYSFHFPAAAQNDYGEIWAWTGTATMTGLGTTAVKITGTFQNSSYYDGITPQPTSDRLLLSQTGYYFVDWQMSFQGSSDVEYRVEPYHAALGTPQAAALVKPYVSGSVMSASGVGIFIATGSAELIDLRVLCSAAGSWLIPRTAQLRVYRVAEY